MATRKATTRAVVATEPKPTREDAVIAAVVQERQERAKATATPTVERLQVTLTPGALKKLDALVFRLRDDDLIRASASALIETAILDLCERDPVTVADLVRRYVGEHAARRRAT